jgi:hypothetical protein
MASDFSVAWQPCQREHFLLQNKHHANRVIQGSPNLFVYFCNLIKLSKVNIDEIGENSPNLVTLAATELPGFDTRVKKVHCFIALI